MIVTMALALASAGKVDCRKLVSKDARPLLVDIASITGSDISNDARPLPTVNAWESLDYQIGRLIYQNNGYSYHSIDPRFRAVEDAIIADTNAICRYAIALPPGWDAAHGEQLHQGQVTFSALSAPIGPRDALSEAGRIGARPTLPGYRLVSSWPTVGDGREFLLGLMAPVRQRPNSETILVAAPLRKGEGAAIKLATLRGRYLKLSSQGNVHGDDIAVTIDGLRDDGSFQNIVLRLSGDDIKALSGAIGSPMQ